MVHFPGLARTRLWIQRAVTWFCQIGFPHSEILGSKPVCDSPRLIAAYRVLHRLLAPRHPPYALSSLTIKLTQHAPTSEPPRTRNQGLASPDFPVRERASVGLEASSAPRSTSAPSFRQVRLSTNATLEQNLRFCVTRTSSSRGAMPTSFSCQRSSFRSQDPERNVSAPGGAQAGLEPTLRKTLKTNKKPGDERRANPSFRLGIVPSDGCARSSSSFYPVFVTNLTSGSVGRPGPSADSPANQGSTNFRLVYQYPKFRQVTFMIFLPVFRNAPVKFTEFCGNRLLSLGPVRAIGAGLRRL
jgi:hypothetical protein